MKNNNFVKKTTMILLVCLIAAVTAANIYAQGPDIRYQQVMQMPPMGGGQNGQMPPMGGGQNGQMPPMGGNTQNGQMPPDSNSQNGQMPPMGPGNNVQNLQKAIDKVTDTDTKASLQTLLDAYQEALEAEKDADEDDRETLRAASMKAMDALLSAMKEAGIEPQLQQNMGGMPRQNNGQMGQMPPMGPRNNVQSLQEGIDKVTDTDTKASLQTLLDAYQEALEAEKDADEDDRETLRAASMKAMDALLSAMKEAGIEPQSQQNMGGIPDQNGGMPGNFNNGMPGGQNNGMQGHFNGGMPGQTGAPMFPGGQY